MFTLYPETDLNLDIKDLGTYAETDQNLDIKDLGTYPEDLVHSRPTTLSVAQ